MDDISGFLLDIEYYPSEDKKNMLRLWLKTEKGIKPVLDTFDPYFYVDAPEYIIKDIEMLKINYKGEHIKIKNYEKVKKIVKGKEKELLKLYCYSPSHIPLIKRALSDFDSYEYKIPFTLRYLINKRLKPLFYYEFKIDKKKGEWVSNIKEHKRDHKKNEKPIEFNALFFDIETYNPLGIPREKKDPIIMISYADKKEAKVMTYRDVDRDFVIKYENEAALLIGFSRLIEEKNIDLIIGYNTSQFDFPYILKRSKMLGIDFSIGVDRSDVRIKKAGMRTNVNISGRISVDLYPVARFLSNIGAVRITRYTLKRVYHELMGEESDSKDLVERGDIWRMWDDDKDRNILADYSLGDSSAVMAISDQLLPVEIELSKICGLQLDQTCNSATGRLVESLLMRGAFERNEIIPNIPNPREVKERRMRPIKAAYVKMPEPGIYSNLAVFDFRSLYPSIIISHNIDPFTLNCDCCSDEEAHISPLGHKFCKKRKGLIPETLENLINRRIELKKRLKTLEKGTQEYEKLFARQWALKILANSHFGQTVYPRARWYSRECGSSITAWGRQYIKSTIEKAEKQGFTVLYSDSLPYDRYVFIKDPKDVIDCIKIGDFVRKNKNNPNLSRFETLAYDGSKIVFKPILRAIEHKYNSKKKGKLLEFITTHGKTIVTPQHSIYYFNENSKKLELIDAKKLGVGDNLISLTNPKLPEINKAGAIIDILDLDFGPYKSELCIYKDNLRFPNSLIGKCPYCGKKRLLSSHVSLQHRDRKLPLEKGKDINWCFVGGKKIRTGRIPRFWKLDKELAWILGYYCADGSASERSKKHNKIMISFRSQDKKIIEKIKKYFDSVLKEDLKIIMDYDKRIKKRMYYYRIQRIPIVALFKYGFKLGNKCTGKRVPPFIYSADESLKKAFLKGYLDGDGTKNKDKQYKTHFIRFNTKSNELAIGLQLLLKSLPHFKTHFGKSIENVHWFYRKGKPGVQDLRLQGIKRSKDELNNFCLAKIKEINKIREMGSVFDLEVKGAHNFVDAEGLILVHNTDSLFLLMKNKRKKDAFEFAKLINKELPGNMELELEGFYPRGVFVTKRTSGKGAKKKYAMIDEKGMIKIRGFELVRRDWSKIAKRTQMNVLKAILKDGDKEKAVKIVKDTIQDLKDGEIPLEDLVIYTQLQKDPNSYAIISPELSATKKAIQRGKKIEKGSLIGYVVTKKGNSISDKAELLEFAEDYDANYYINKQILPPVLKILKELGYKEDDLKFKGRQTALDKFF